MFIGPLYPAAIQDGGVIEAVAAKHPPEARRPGVHGAIVNHHAVAFANTVAAYSFTQRRSGHGWLGIRFQTSPQEDASQIDIHVVLKGNEVTQDQDTLGVLGVNLIYGAMHLHDDPDGHVVTLGIRNVPGPAHEAA